VFRSTSDTETLLRGWVCRGPQWIHRLRGMFAFAVLDGRRRELWLARDHCGVKPLYVAHSRPDVWLFASEVRALLASGLVSRRLSSSGLSSYLAFGAAQSPQTLLAGVQSLQPGERWRFDLSDPARAMAPHGETYWRPEFTAPQGDEAPGEPFSPGSWTADYAGRLNAVWEQAVQSQMLSDVPVAIFLSGGVDSGAIAATLARLGQRPKTFSVIFQEEGFDESRFSRSVADRCGTEHTEIVLTPAEVVAQFDGILGAYDQPSIDGGNTYTIARAIRAAGIKVALSGLGGDEVFAGYGNFVRLARWERALKRTPGLLRRLAGTMARRCPRQTGRFPRLLQLLASPPARLPIYRILRQLYSPTMRSRVTAGRLNDAEDIDADLASRLDSQAEATDPVNAAGLLELALYLQNMPLRDTDQMSMAHSLEVRVPLLDHHVVEEIARMPGPCKLPPGGPPNKWLLVKLAGALLPPEVAARPKMGFVLPWDRWLRGPLEHRMQEILLDGGAAERAGLDPKVVASLWCRYLQGQHGVRSSDVLGLAHLIHWVGAHRLGPLWDAPADLEALTPCPTKALALTEGTT